MGAFNTIGGSGFSWVSKIPDYEKQYQRGLLKAFRAVTQVVAKRARQLAPRAVNHRTDRTYPGGRKYTGEKPIYKSVAARARVGRSRSKIVAFVKVQVGYSVFVNYGTKFTRRNLFLQRAVTESAPQIMSLVKAEWPK